MKFLSLVRFQNYFIPLLGLHQVACSLIPRARTNGGIDVVGPPNEPVQCDLKYGAPIRDDCDNAITWISGALPEDEEDFERDEANWDAYHRVYYTVVEFLSPQAERENEQRPAIRTPKFWRFGTCIIGVSVSGGLGQRSSDEAAWRDVATSGYEILETCVDDARLHRGGAQTIGEHNNLNIEVFAADSEHGEEAEVILGHAVPSYTEEPRGLIQPDYIDDSDEDMEMQEAICFAGESAGYLLNARKCCSGYKFILRKFKDVHLLLGVDVVSLITSTIGTCLKI